MVHLVIAASGDDAYMPRIVVAAGDGARASIVESRAGRRYLSNLAVQVTVGRTRMGHYVLQAESSDAFHVSMTRTVLAEKACYDNFALSWGGRLARNEIRGALNGPRGDYRVNGAYIAAGEQHLDTTTFIDHAVPDCESREVYKGVLDGSSRGVFQGKILVRPDAQRTDGYQMNRAMLLSSSAEIDNNRSSRSTPTTSSAATARRLESWKRTSSSTSWRVALTVAGPGPCWLRPTSPMLSTRSKTLMCATSSAALPRAVSVRS